MKKKNKSMIVYIIIGIIIGYLSQLGRNFYGEQGNFVAFGLMLLFLMLTAEINRRVFKIKKNFKWFWSNGGWIYIVVWFITWIVFFNLSSPTL